MFGRKKLPFDTPDYMTPGGGIGGGLPGMPGSGIDMSVPEDPYEGQRPEGKPGFFGKMGINSVGDGLGFLADAFMFGPAMGIVRKNRRTNEENMRVNNIYKQALATKALRENDNDTPAMREAAAMGFQPGTPEFNSYVRRARMKPSFMMMGNPEVGQQIVDPEAMGGFGGGQPTTKQLPDGRTGYWVQNGAEGPGWYDNPEGR